MPDGILFFALSGIRFMAGKNPIWCDTKLLKPPTLDKQK